MSENKRQKKLSFLANLLTYIADRKSLLAVTLLITVLGKLGLSFAPKTAGMITDELAGFAVTGVLNEKWILLLAGLTAFLYLAGNLIDGIVQRNMLTISQALCMRLRDRAAGKFNRLSFKWLDAQPAGDIQSVVTTDILSVGNALEGAIPSLLGHSVLLISIFVIMLATEWKLTVIYAVTLPLMLLLVLMISKKSSRLYAKQMQTQAELNAFVSDSCANHMLIRAFSCEEKKLEEFDRINGQFYKDCLRSRFYMGFTVPIGTLTNNVSFILLCLIGGAMMIRGSLTLGSFQMFLFFGNMLNEPMTSISYSISSIMEARAAMERVSSFLEREEMPAQQLPEQAGKGTVQGEVEFRHVRFGYVPGKPLMKDVSFKVSAGSKTAIAGPSGAGKTTLVNLLMRFYEIDGGSILIDGRDISGLGVAEVRSAFGMVLQDSWIFDGTVLENIAYGKPGASEDEVIRAAKAAECDDLIRKLPEGYHTWLTAGNSPLSAGEMQLLSIARCVLSDPKILILDEATSQVDSRTEYRIARAMEQLMEGRTCFMIAHRLFTVRNADQILFMKDGDIRETGTHEELMALDGAYARMYREMA